VRGNDDEDSIEVLSIEVTESDGKAAFEVPSSAPAGVSRIELVNSGKDPRDAQLIRVEGDRSPREVFDALENAQRGVPDWFFLAGGPDTTQPGETTSVVQELEPGTYFAVDTESFDPSSTTELEVTGEADGELPEAQAAVSAFEYGFEAEGLKAGTNEILFENTGAQPHHLRAAPLLPGKTLDDVREFVETERGGPPVDLDKEVSTSALEGGASQVVELELEAGEYAMLCFVADREGGPPHVAKGMIAQAVVAE
jgi:hypothetical protein